MKQEMMKQAGDVPSLLAWVRGEEGSPTITPIGARRKLISIRLGMGAFFLLQESSSDVSERPERGPNFQQGRDLSPLYRQVSGCSSASAELST